MVDAMSAESRDSSLLERPIFVVGSPRSGTTLLRYVLTSHPRIYIPPESNFIPRFFARRPGALTSREKAEEALGQIVSGYKSFFKDWVGDRPDPAHLLDGVDELTPRTMLDALYGAYAAQRGAARWGDKTPLYTVHIDSLAEIFPTAQFVHIIRDGRDVALSMADSYQGARFFYIDLYYAARMWRRRVERASASGRSLGDDRYREIRYESLVTQPEHEIRELCHFLGEDYHQAMVSPELTASAHHHSSGIHRATRRPLNADRVFRWRDEMAPADQRLYLSVAGDLLDRLGYDRGDPGSMNTSDKWRRIRLSAKFSTIEAGRVVLQQTGVFHPTALLSRLRRIRQ
jgi:hypothetical protein